jgi:hypothetical protein
MSVYGLDGRANNQVKVEVRAVCVVMPWIGEITEEISEGKWHSEKKA